MAGNELDYDDLDGAFDEMEKRNKSVHAEAVEIEEAPDEISKEVEPVKTEAPAKEVIAVEPAKNPKSVPVVNCPLANQVKKAVGRPKKITEKKKRFVLELTEKSHKKLFKAAMNLSAAAGVNISIADILRSLSDEYETNPDLKKKINDIVKKGAKA